MRRIQLYHVNAQLCGAGYPTTYTISTTFHVDPWSRQFIQGSHSNPISCKDM
ncbi:hypothetical protein CY34DRAFT_808370, partial [Suillus luteus UH-Slu-Lm8-n1]